jgi:hypothetical protein
MTSVLTPADRRSNRRYALDTPVRYRAANGPLNAAWKNGRLLNMSASGLLIHVPEPLAIGTKLELSVEWTGLYHGRQNMRLFLISWVTRTGGRGVALRILSHRFREMSQSQFQRAQTAVA